MNWDLWRWPIVLAVLTTIGLGAGLVSDGVGDWIAWIGLGLPVLVSLWFGVLRRGSEPPR